MKLFYASLFLNQMLHMNWKSVKKQVRNDKAKQIFKRTSSHLSSQIPLAIENPRLTV